MGHSITAIILKGEFDKPKAESYDLKGKELGFGLAVTWHKKSALKNDTKTIYNLGLCYAHGDGTTQSTRWAKHYYSKAAKMGHAKSKEKLKHV